MLFMFLLALIVVLTACKENTPDDPANPSDNPDSGESIVISGGTIYIYAGGDGIDSNSTSSYDGILFAGGNVLVISTGRGDSSIDTKRGYKYTSGTVVAIGVSGGMSKESTMSSPSVTTIGKTATVSLKKDGYLVVEGVVTVKLPITQNSFIVSLGEINKTANIKFSTSSNCEFDSNGVCWEK